MLYKPDHRAALELLKELMPHGLRTESIHPVDAAGRICARDVTARAPYPPEALSLKDGLAVELTSPHEPGRWAPIRTGEPLPQWARDVIPEEDLDPHKMTRREPKPAGTRPDWIRAGQEYEAGDVIAARGERLRYPQISQLCWFGCDHVEVYRRPRVQVICFDREPQATTSLVWLRGFIGSYHAAIIREVRVNALDELKKLDDDCDLRIVVSDEAPGRYNELKQLASRSNPPHGFDMRVWKMALYPCKHLGFGTLRGVLTLVFPDLFFKTVLSAMMLLPPLLADWVHRPLLTLPARWAEPPRLTYPLPCLVPLRLADERHGLEVIATKLRSSFSARFASKAEANVILTSPPRLEDEFEAVIHGRLG